VPWLKLIFFKETWAFALGKFLTDPVWYFYTFWLPSYFVETYHLKVQYIAAPIIIIYIISDIGSIAGGWLSSTMIARGATAIIAESEVSKTVGIVASFAFLFILILTLAGLSIAVLNALFESFWGVFVVAATIPIAIFMGVWMYKIRPGKVVEASLIGVVIVLAGVVLVVHAALLFEIDVPVLRHVTGGVDIRRAGFEVLVDDYAAVYGQAGLRREGRGGGDADCHEHQVSGDD